MSRVALLMGVSRYPTGLDPLPDAQKDVEVMKRVLQQPCFQFEVQDCCDRPLQAMQEAIELFFAQRTRDDQIVFLFCGYTLQDADGRLYFATPSTQLEAAGTFVQAQTIPASLMQDVMNRSPARQQVLILDTYNQPALQPTEGADPSGALSAQLGGTGRVILVANGKRPYPTPTAIDAWTYTRYLAEGIESGSADMDDDGSLTAADLHHYATQKLQVAAPGLTPQLYGNSETGSLETARIPLLEVPHDDPQVRYRKVLEAATIAATVDAAGLPILEGRSLLNDVRHSLGVSLQTAAALEAQVLRPVQEYRQRLEFYQEQVANYARSHELASPAIHQALKPVQQALCLTDRDVAMRTIAPSLAEQHRQQAHYQGNLAQYQQVLLGAMQRQSPLQEGDRVMLHRLQQILGLKDDDVRETETQITTQVEPLLAADTLPATEIVEPPTTHERHNSMARSPESTASNSDLLPSEVSETGLPDDSRAKEVVLQRLFNMTEPTRPSSSGHLFHPEATPAPDQPSTTVQETSPPVVPTAQSTTAQSNMDRIRRSTSNYQALLIPLILLGAIIGLVAAMLSSGNRPDWFKFGQAPVDLTAAQNFKNDGLRKAREGYNKEAIADYDQAIQKNPKDATTYINRGVARHKLGDPGAAIKDYEEALKLAPNDALLHSNLSHAYYDRQNYDKAFEEGNRAVAQNPRLAQAYINLANARAKRGDTNGALEDYQRALRLRPSAEVQAGAYNNQGNVKLALNKTGEALRDYTQATRLNANYADAYYNLGLVQQAQGNNRTAAISNLRKAADLYQQQKKDALQKEATDRANALQKGSL